MWSVTRTLWQRSVAAAKTPSQVDKDSGYQQTKRNELETYVLNLLVSGHRFW